MPASINNTLLPPNPRQREYRRNKTRGELAVLVADAFAKSTRGTFFAGGPVVPYPVTIEWVYAGYVQSAISFTRRGLFNQIEEQFTEYFRGTDNFYTADGVINVRAAEAFSDVNFNF
jgi:hypothetical protein